MRALVPKEPLRQRGDLWVVLWEPLFYLLRIM